MQKQSRQELVEYPLRRGLRGTAALALWGNVSGDEDLFDTWYTHEHLPERVAIPGFLRARRFVSCPEASDGAAWKYFTLYEVRSGDTLSSPAYLELLNNPTPATSRCLPQFSNLRRTACRVTSSRGWGQGGHVFVAELGPAPGRSDELRGWLSGSLGDAILQRSGALAVHLLEKDAGGTAVAQSVAVYGNVPTAAGRWLYIVEGAWIDPASAAKALAADLRALPEHGAAGDHSSQMFRLLAEMTAADGATE